MTNNAKTHFNVVTRSITININIDNIIGRCVSKMLPNPAIGALERAALKSGLEYLAPPVPIKWPRFPEYGTPGRHWTLPGTRLLSSGNQNRNILPNGPYMVETCPSSHALEQRTISTHSRRQKILLE